MGECRRKRSGEGCWVVAHAAMVEMRPPMSESDFTSPKPPLVLRVEISAEQANALTPLFEGGSAVLPASPAPVSEEVVDARVLELKDRETDLEELEQTLERREKDLVSYVDQLQGAMSGSTGDAWWSRPAGGDGGVR
jgi:hypothetical protein